MKFTGYLRDADTGLDYADQRYESPGTGRFLSADRMTGTPNDPRSWNKYAYVGGDPINKIDPQGLYEEGDDQGYCKNNPMDLGCTSPVAPTPGKSSKQANTSIVDAW